MPELRAPHCHPAPLGRTVALLARAAALCACGWVCAAFTAGELCLEVGSELGPTGDRGEVVPACERMHPGACRRCMSLVVCRSLQAGGHKPGKLQKHVEGVRDTRPDGIASRIGRGGRQHREAMRIPVDRSPGWTVLRGPLDRGPRRPRPPDLPLDQRCHSRRERVPRPRAVSAVRAGPGQLRETPGGASPLTQQSWPLVHAGGALEGLSGTWCLRLPRLQCVLRASSLLCIAGRCVAFWASCLSVRLCGAQGRRPTDSLRL